MTSSFFLVKIVFLLFLDMIPGVNIIGGKASELSNMRALQAPTSNKNV